MKTILGIINLILGMLQLCAMLDATDNAPTTAEKPAPQPPRLYE